MHHPECGMTGGEEWLWKGGRLEYQRGTNHGGGGAWLTASRVPQDGKTSLWLAVEGEHEEVVGVLLKAGTDKEAKGKVRGGG